MPRPRRNDERRPVAKRMLDAVDDRDSLPFFDADELVAVLVHFFSYLFPDGEGHENKLGMLSRIEDAAEVLILQGLLLDIRDESFHMHPVYASRMPYTTAMPDNSFKEAALAFLKERETGALATRSPEGAPRVRTVYYAADDSFSIYFLTLAPTRKADDLISDPRAAFVVSDTGEPRTLQMEGVVENLTGTATDTMPAVRALIERTQARGPQFAPPARLDAASILFFRLVPSWARFGDFTKGQGSAEVFSEIPV